MQSFFTSDFFAANRTRLREKLADDTTIFIPSNGLLQQNGDTTFPFAQDSNFWYLTGIDEPDCTLVMSSSGDYLLTADRDEVRVAFDGALNAAALTKRSGIVDIVAEAEGWKRLKSESGQFKQIAITEPPMAYLARHGFYTNPARRRMIGKLRRHFPRAIYLDIRPHLAALRSIKQKPELAALQRAVNITAETISDIRSAVGHEAFKYEYQLEAAIMHGFRNRGARGHAFAPIVANGQKATTLHNTSNDGLLAKDQLTLVDIGAEVEHYAADISRTFSTSKPSARQKQVHDAVVEAQTYALSLIKPGLEMKAYEQSVAEKIGQKLVELGVTKSAEPSEIRRYFPHATSHFLGLDTHDVGDYSKPLQPGMVITCEPGIYLPEEGIGVRIEDDVLITESGCEVLSAACPRQAF